MDATTSLIFSNAGISPTMLTTFLGTIFNQCISFMIYTFETVWPYLLVLALIGVIVGIAFGALHLTRRA